MVINSFLFVKKFKKVPLICITKINCIDKITYKKNWLPVLKTFLID